MTQVAGEMRLNLPTKLQLEFYFCPIIHFIKMSELRKFRGKTWKPWEVKRVRGAFLWGNMKQREYIEDLGLVDRRIILKWILKKYKGSCGLDSFGFGLGTTEGLL